MTQTEITLLNQIIELRVDKIVKELKTEIQKDMDAKFNQLVEIVQAGRNSSQINESSDGFKLKTLSNTPAGKQRVNTRRPKVNELAERFGNTPLGEIFANTSPLEEDDDMPPAPGNEPMEELAITEGAKDVLDLISNTDWSSKLKKMEKVANETRKMIANQ